LDLFNVVNLDQGDAGTTVLAGHDGGKLSWRGASEIKMPASFGSGSARLFAVGWAATPDNSAGRRSTP
jgi:hypothetical protein